MIENNYSVLESVFHAYYGPPPDAYRGLSAEEAARLEEFRRRSARLALSALGMAKTIASRFPAEAVEAKVTADWLLSKGRGRRSELVKVVEAYGERGRAWLEEQARQIAAFLTGRLIYDPRLRRLVRVG
jgi:LmbE family N-acetylglucosaminyl deacetylase